MISCGNKTSSAEQVHEEFIDSVESIIDKDSLEHRSYLILSASVVYHVRYIPSGYLIGPLYKGLSQAIKANGYYRLFTYKGKEVYILNIGKKSQQIKVEAIKFSQQDSFLLYKSTFIKDPLINYIKRAKLLYYVDDTLMIKNNVDSLILPNLSSDDPI